MYYTSIQRAFIASVTMTIRHESGEMAFIPDYASAAGQSASEFT